MVAPTLSLPYSLTAADIMLEIERLRTEETDADRWRILDPEYLAMLGGSVLLRHSIHVLVWQGVHPDDLIVSVLFVSSCSPLEYVQDELSELLSVARFTRVGRALYFRSDTMEIDDGLTDQVSK